MEWGGKICKETHLKLSEDPFYLTRPALDGAIEAIRVLHDSFGDNMMIISKVTVRSEPKILEWLDTCDFWERTRMPKGNIRFCRERHEKAPICDELGVTHFIDNRIEVLYHLGPRVEKFALCPKDEDLERYKDFLLQVHIHQSWNEVMNAVRSSLMHPKMLAG